MSDRAITIDSRSYLQRFQFLVVFLMPLLGLFQIRLHLLQCWGSMFDSFDRSEQVVVLLGGVSTQVEQRRTMVFTHFGYVRCDIVRHDL
jgi:hypothetical protein